MTATLAALSVVLVAYGKAVQVRAEHHDFVRFVGPREFGDEVEGRIVRQPVQRIRHFGLEHDRNPLVEHSCDPAVVLARDCEHGQRRHPPGTVGAVVSGVQKDGPAGSPARQQDSGGTLLGEELEPDLPKTVCRRELRS